MDSYYAFLLDLFPLMHSLHEEQSMLSIRLQECALRELFRRHRDFSELQVLLQLCHDLGYIDEDVYSYLYKGLVTCRESI